MGKKKGLIKGSDINMAKKKKRKKGEERDNMNLSALELECKDLEVQKSDAVEKEDYDTAKKLKATLEAKREEIRLLKHKVRLQVVINMKKRKRSTNKKEISNANKRIKQNLSTLDELMLLIFGESKTETLDVGALVMTRKTDKISVGLKVRVPLDPKEKKKSNGTITRIEKDRKLSVHF